MKKLLKSLLLLTVLGSVAFLYSCGEDDEPLPDAPTVIVDVTGVTFSNGAITAQPGQTADITITINAPGVFNTLDIVKSVDGVAGTPQIINRNSAGVTLTNENKNAVINISYTFVAGDVGKAIEWVFTAVDDNNLAGDAEITATVTSPTARVYTAILLNPPTADKTNKNFYSTSSGTRYSSSEVTATATPISPTIDFGYYYTSSAFLASPKAFSDLTAAGTATIKDQVTGWSKLNETTLRTTTMTAAQFNEVATWADIDTRFDAGTAPAQSKGSLVVGQVLAFQTDATKTGGAKKGLILVKAITGTFNQNDSIELEIKVQESAN